MLCGGSRVGLVPCPFLFFFLGVLTPPLPVLEGTLEIQIDCAISALPVTAVPNWRLLAVTQVYSVQTTGLPPEHNVPPPPFGGTALTAPGRLPPPPPSSGFHTTLLNSDGFRTS